MKPTRDDGRVRGGRRGSISKAGNSDPILAHRAVLAELERVQRDGSLTQARKQAAIETLRRAQAEEDRARANATKSHNTAERKVFINRSEIDRLLGLVQLALARGARRLYDLDDIGPSPQDKVLG